MEKEHNGGENEEANGTTYGCTNECFVYTYMRSCIQMVFYIRVRVARGVGFLHSCFTIKQVNPSLGPSLSPFWRRVLVRDW